MLPGQELAIPYWPCRCCKRILWERLGEHGWICAECLGEPGEEPTHEELLTLGPAPKPRPYGACSGCGLHRYVSIYDEWWCAHCGTPWSEPPFIPQDVQEAPPKAPPPVFGTAVPRTERKHTAKTQEV